MAVTSVTLVDLPHGDAVLRPVRVGDRISARLRVAALDRALAGGATPDSGVALSLHARRLIAPRTRRRLARTLQGIVAAPHQTGAQVRRAASDLLALAARLERRDAVDARGVALVRVLLSDGGGPLHANRGAQRLAEAAHQAAAALDPS